MELKDMILSTLAELEAVTPKEEAPKPQADEKHESVYEMIQEEILHIETSFEQEKEEEVTPIEIQKQFYVNLRERILVLFEGFQSPNNKNIEAKIDLTLNFLEYLLASIDEHLEIMDKTHK